jgi:hypothetical protein
VGILLVPYLTVFYFKVNLPPSLVDEIKHPLLLLLLVSEI